MRKERTGNYSSSLGLHQKLYDEIYEKNVTVEMILDEGKVNLTEEFNINDHCALIEKIEVEEAVKTDLSDGQLDNLTAYFTSLPSEPAMKLWSVVGASSEKNAIGLHTRSGDFLVRILAG